MGYYNFFAKQDVTYLGNILVRIKISKIYKYIHKNLKCDSKSINILEIGPGRGELASLFLKNDYTNYDIVEPNDILRNKLEALGVRNAKGYQIPRLHEKDASFDLIILLHVFEHLNDAREAKLFTSEAARVLKQNGHIIIMSPEIKDYGIDFWNNDYTHSYPTSVRRIAQLFADYGISIIAYKNYYSCFEGMPGYLISRVVKLLTIFANGESVNSKLYKLRLTFLRNFIIIGQLNDIMQENGNDNAGSCNDVF